MTTSDSVVDTKRHVETEFKFCVSSTEDLDRLVNWFKNEEFDLSGPRTVNREYTYFDTPDRCLLNSGIYLRLVIGDENGDRWFRYDMKIPTADAQSRTELSDKYLTQPKEPKALQKLLLRPELNGLISPARLDRLVTRLRKLHVFDGTHTKYTAKKKSLDMELSFDEIKLINGCEFKELEIELATEEGKDAAPEQIACFKKLVAAVSQELALFGEFRSKPQKAAELLNEYPVTRIALENVIQLFNSFAGRPFPFIVDQKSGTGEQQAGQDEETLGVRLSRDRVCLSLPSRLPHILSDLVVLEQNAASVGCFLEAATACDLVGPDPSVVRKQWAYLVSRGCGHETAYRMLTALQALIELRAKPDVIFFDDLPFIKGKDQSSEWEGASALWRHELAKFARIFNVHCPPLPVQHGRAKENPDYLFPFIEYELTRLPRLTAAVVDLHWFCADNGQPDEQLGLDIIRQIRGIKPNVPIFIWSNIENKRVLQRALQLGAAYYFNKELDLGYGHGQSGTDPDNLLNPGKLWFHIWEFEQARYALPARSSGADPFITGDTPEGRDSRKKFMRMFDLQPSHLAGATAHEVVRLLKSLVPDAASVEIVKVFGGGRSGSHDPFIVRGKTSGGQLLKPMQIKISDDWRALARERKGYRDVIETSLGPAAAQVLAGPCRLNEWCGMAQSFAAPEETYDRPESYGTGRLLDFLKKNLHQPDVCQQLVEAVFDGVLAPLYSGRTERQAFSCHKAFVDVSPSHLQGKFRPVQNEGAPAPWDFAPLELSQKDEKTRREHCHRKWRRAVLQANGNEAPSVVLQGLVIDTLECDAIDPLKSRLRVIDRTLGIKLDLYPNNLHTAKRWRELQSSPIKLRGLPVEFALAFPAEAIVSGRIDLSRGWRQMLQKKADDFQIRPAGSLAAVGKKTGAGGGRDEFSDGCLPTVDYLMTFHPLDVSEQFLLGPVHGDLNLSNILLYERNGVFFPWLIDFDKTHGHHPIVFDLVKLEVEAYHQVGHALFSELCETCRLAWWEDEKDTYALPHFVRDFEAGLENPATTNLQHLWDGFSEELKVSPSESLKHRFDGFFRYLRTVRSKIRTLGIKPREYLIARVWYCLCCLKFKNLYSAKNDPDAPFAAQLLLYKLQYTIQLLDRHNGILIDPGEQADYGVINAVIKAIRQARLKVREQDAGKEGTPQPFAKVIEQAELDSGARQPKPTNDGAGLFTDRLYDGENLDDRGKRIRTYERLLRILRNKSLRGDNMWFREVLWYIRDYGTGLESDVAEFTLAMVFASIDGPREESPRPKADRVDYASTGRVANTYPTKKMLEHLCGEKGKGQLVKISSRGESGGTIDILERAGLTICRSRGAVAAELERNGWAIATADEQLCEVDRIMMALRKTAGCMKVGDLVIASISAKKIALDIGRFEVQIATGYDAKFEELLEGDTDEDEPKSLTDQRKEDLQKRWEKVWSEICTFLAKANGSEVMPGETGGNSSSVTSGFVDSDKLEFPEDENRPTVIGDLYLAASVFGPYIAKLRQNHWPSGALTELEERGKKISREPSSKDFTLQAIKTPCPLVDAAWSLMDNVPDNPGMAALCIKFNKAGNGTNWRLAINVPFFDDLYAGFAKSGNCLTSVFFFPDRICILVPKDTLPPNRERWCWRIVREGFDWTKCDRVEASTSTARCGAILVGT